MPDRKPTVLAQETIRSVALWVALVSLLASPGASQNVDDFDDSPSAGEFALAAVLNAGVPALLAAFMAGSRPDVDVRDAAVRAAAGGALHFAGKTLAGVERTGAGLAGRYIGAAGSSISGNVLAGKPATGCFSLPLGPLWVNTGECGRPSVTLDLTTVIAIIRGSFAGELLVGESLATGSFVFAGDGNLDRPYTAGWAMGGVAFVRAAPDNPTLEAARIRHEIIHVVQHDAGMLMLSRPAEDWVRRRAPGRAQRMSRSVDFGLYALAGGILATTPADPTRILEAEALLLDGR